ncbi:DUF1634 domain-containing protein [Ornithinimicrobium pratense]|uniref:DUF1634 domain-containing protein n=1 Tax=Ornithinimicrobium pratense TaxID=2593973 RepID=A0A5J6V4P8_9MICO|nr:DUF1634 domain-containing protein [Ornithinimicrobium pratense]QFG68101.1 DUF1634 domain-containing protein [Ornithinimicrobium pratense]
MIALVSAGTPASEEDVRGYASLAEGQLAWDEATQGLDDLIVTRMEQAGGVPSDEARAATEDAAEELITLVEEAQVVSPLPYSTALERAVTGIRAIATDQSPGAVRPVNQWREQRYSLTDGASNRRAFTDATETMTPGSPLAWWLLGIMLLALAELIRLAVKDRAYVALALLGVAGVTGVASMVYLGIYQQVGSMADSVSARDDVARDHRSTVDAQGRDLGVIFGVDRSVLGDEEHWTRIYFHDLEEIDPEVAQNYWDVRAGFADLGPEEQLARAPELVSALEPVWEQRREDLQAANAAVIAAVDHPPGVAPLLLTTLVTAGLAVGAVFVPSHRPDRLRTTAALSGNASRGGDVKRANDVSAKGEGSRDSRTARGQNAQPRNTGRNTRRNTPARGRAGRRGGRR